MESEFGTSNTKISDSGYSVSCSNSNSQRSASSKSRISGSNSSGSSGFCGNETDISERKRNKDKDHKAKRKSGNNLSVPNVTNTLQDQRLSRENFENLDIGDENTLPKDVEVNQNVSTPENSTTVPENLYSNEFKDENSFSNNEGNEDLDLSKNTDSLEDVAELSNEPVHPKDGFCCILSMVDGVVLYTTPSITEVLGFPKDFWLGRSFIDFVHPKDKETFSTQITMGIGLPLFDSSEKQTKETQCSFFISVRRYRGLKTSGFGVVEKAVAYKAFHLTVTFRPGADLEDFGVSDYNGAFLIIVALPVYSSYAVPNEMIKTKKFGMRHTASCTFSHVDADVVKNFGFLPQDMMGKSVFDFYHPEDMSMLKQVYEIMINECQIAGTVYKSKPYRFAVKNGGFVKVETEWSCFANPWSKRLEFVIGVYTVIQGPENPNIFELGKSDRDQEISETILRDAKLIREEILLLLSGEVKRPCSLAKREVSKNCKNNLSMFMEEFVKEVAKINARGDSTKTQDVSVSERYSVTLGEISPHHDYFDRESSETPPSYNQLNYNENIQRFFESKPTTAASDESGDRIMALQISCDAEEGPKNSASDQECNSKCLSSEENSGISTISSGKNLASSSVHNLNDPYPSLPLTEEVLHRHNEDMENIMKQRHREQRSNSKADRGGKKHLRKSDRNLRSKCQPHGIKRGVPTSGDVNNHKISKHNHCPAKKRGDNYENVFVTSEMRSRQMSFQPETNRNLWPPFPTPNNPHDCAPNVDVSNGVRNFPTRILPVYYIPTQNRTSSDNVQFQYMPGVVYDCKSVFPTSPLFCSPLAMVPIQVPSTSAPAVCNDINLAKNPIGLQPAAKATSVGSRKNLGLQSACSSDTVTVTPSDTTGNVELDPATKVEPGKSGGNQWQDEESSYSSFYSSFLKTDTGSSSNEESNCPSKNKENNGLYRKPKARPARKCDPPWMETVNVTPDLIYRYQMNVKSLEDVLASDLKSLKEINQPELVNDQLNQLYLEMELDGLCTKLTLEEEITSSSSSGEETTSKIEDKLRKKRSSYSSLMMIYEEDAPFPPSDNN